MHVRAVMLVVIVAAVAIGFALPRFHDRERPQVSQLQTVDITP